MRKKIESPSVIDKQQHYDNYLLNNCFSPSKLGKAGTTRGTISETIFLTEALRHDWSLARPILSSETYDFILLLDGIWQTVQVKTARNHGNPNGLRVDVGRGRDKQIPYNDGDFDLLAAVEPEGGRIWLIPWLRIRGLKRHVCLTGNKYRCYRIN